MPLPPVLRDIEEVLTAANAKPAPDVGKTIYSLLFPETLAAILELWACRPDELYRSAFNGGQEKIPPIFLNAWREGAPVYLGSSFPYAYATGGASEPIKDLIVPRPNTLHPLETSTDIAEELIGTGVRVNMFNGDYEGFGKIAEARGIPVRTHSRATFLAECDKIAFTPMDVFWITDPSSIDGDHWEGFEDFLDRMLSRHPKVKIYLDATYVGAVKRVVDREVWRYPNVEAVIVSVSKPFGVYYHRVGGVYSRHEIKSLEANKWFCNPFSLALGTLLIREYGLMGELPRKYAAVQEQVVADAIAEGILPVSARAGNVVLFANARSGPEAFHRADGNYRWCVTPGMYRVIHGGAR